MKAHIFAIFSSMLIFGCASSVTYTKNEIRDLFELDNSPSAWSPNLNEIESLFSLNSTKPTENIIFNYYCRQGNQIRSLKTKIQVVLPPPSLNMPLDQTAKAQEERRQIAHDYISNLYKALFFDEQLTRSGLDEEITRSNFFALNQNNSASMQPSLIFDRANNSLKLIFGLSHFEIQYDKNKFLIPKYFFVGTENQNRAFVVANSKVVQAFPSDKSQETITYQTTTDLRLIENVLAQKFTILKSYDTQKSITELIRPAQLKNTWITYLNEFTTYKEAQANDADVINYEVTLDLGEFCKYGRPINDLLSK